MGLSIVDHRPVVSSFPNDLRESVPGNATALDRKYAAVLLVKIGLRPGNNVDVMEMLGLIPAAPKPVVPNSGRWPRAVTS